MVRLHGQNESGVVSQEGIMFIDLRRLNKEMPVKGMVFGTSPTSLIDFPIDFPIDFGALPTLSQVFIVSYISKGKLT